MINISREFPGLRDVECEAKNRGMIPQPTKWKGNGKKVSQHMVKAVEGGRLWVAGPSIMWTFLGSPPWCHHEISYQSHSIKIPQQPSNCGFNLVCKYQYWCYISSFSLTAWFYFVNWPKLAMNSCYSFAIIFLAESWGVWLMFSWQHHRHSYSDIHWEKYSTQSRPNRPHSSKQQWVFIMVCWHLSLRLGFLELP